MRTVNAPHLAFLILTVAGWLGRRQAATVEYLVAENRVLREELGDRRLRLTDAQRRRLAVRGKAIGRRALGEIALSNLGHDVGRTTVKRILVENGIDPAPERGRRSSWGTFLKAHRGAIAAMDFFTVEAGTWTGLMRCFVLIVIDLETRRVEVAGIVHHPDGRWTAQIARNLTDVADGFLRDKRYVIHDRDPLFTAELRTTLESAGVTPIRLPAESPNLNACAERFVRSIKEGAPNRVVPLGEGHLRTVVCEDVSHYHEERNHQGIDNSLIEERGKVVALGDRVARRERPGGLLNDCYRDAA